jgi:hypothetical protein
VWALGERQEVGRKKNSARAQVRNLRKFVEARMGGIRSLLAAKHTTLTAPRMALGKHVEEIVLLPDGDRPAIKYRGKWKLLGSSDGAEGGNRTQRLAVEFRIPIAA